ncbi:peroxisomal hydratase-dehydrogenase-epimerase-like protein [Melampsora larici-populina 98AG31]|uniref:Peroxisomal hydratase-dehydrogenase-epimerase-like protein n=1 Tax=Melampsora larici-populina (strain 98AG31 / pathotype 3-4-7) TaxID=747676 RepID=F4RGN7_MELLP|nr:peroxisomal hydratase-dehydrogenase-epimerase-like protein [Melampsora larici-populina 98AG31]EGG08566.1 peroxisomal hydratase-dehydrogenase-epimerase-like protein [Melampsora larici-populina 98AG31]
MMAPQIDFSKKTVIVTGGGGGLGKCYALFFASRGANVVVNDMGKQAADQVVSEIKSNGKGQAIANYDNVIEGHKIVKQAVDVFGSIHILINNAGVLRDKSFKSMSDQDWDTVQAVHVQGPYACTKAAWPIFREQKYGRIINTTSAAGIYGNFGQANYSAAKLSQVAFAKTLAREGAKYNIIANAIAPVAASQMTATIMPPEMLKELSPESIVPLVAFLASDQTKESGQVFEAGAGWYGKLRWERTRGAVFKADDTFTPSAIMARFDEINNFDQAEYPENITDAHFLDYLEQGKQLSTNPQSSKPLTYSGKTVIVTGAGNGLGRAYALMYAKLGANVLVNDMNSEAASKVVDEIKRLGAKAVANTSSVEDGQKVVKAALDNFGSLHVIVNNAGILRDKSFISMTDAEWDIIQKVHLRGTYSVCHAAWPIFIKQKFGRILNTTSAVGLYGNFGQANYSTAKAGILGLTKTLAIEGKKYNIFCNTIAPNAGTSMTATVWPEERVQAFKPDFVAPLVGYLTSEANEQTSGQLYEVSGGWCAAVRWQRSYGLSLPSGQVSPENLAAQWQQVVKFDEKATYPTSTTESLEQIIANFGSQAEEGSSSVPSIDDAFKNQDFLDPEDSQLVKEAKKYRAEPDEYTFNERDCILYNMGIGVNEKQLQYVFEGHPDFQVLPTFGVVPQFNSSSGLPLDWLPNFNPKMLLHGEQYLSIKTPSIPTSGTFVNFSRLLEASDKGKAASLVSVSNTYDKETGKLLFETQSTVFIRGAGGFGGRKQAKDRGVATALNKPPNREPDRITTEMTDEKAAAIYRLSGDYNPLHIDPAFAAVGGFKKPILHGLCFFGMCGKHVVEAFGQIDSIKARFVGSMYPGETLVTMMWKEGNKVVFIGKCKERDVVVLGNAAATLV